MRWPGVFGGGFKQEDLFQIVVLVFIKAVDKFISLLGSFFYLCSSHDHRRN